MVKIRLVSWEKIFVLPPSQPAPNIPKIKVTIFVTDYNQLLEVDADWAETPAQRKQNVAQAVKTALANLYDDTKGEYDYNPTTGTLTKV